jgi:hypothetical protein
MLVKLLRQILTVLVVTAYSGVVMLQASSRFVGSAETHHPAISGIMHTQDNPGDNMPCKGMPPGCFGDLGCIFLVSLPAPDLTVASVTAWSSVSYDNAHQELRGRTIKPALGPPIRFA